MAKKLIALLAVAAFLLGTGWYMYWKMARPIPVRTPVTANWPATASGEAPVASESAAGHASAVSSTAPGESKEPAASPAGFVLRQGETLEYDANVTKLNSTVARLKISAVEKRIHDGKGTWHLQALAHTENPYRMVFELDDQFDSFSDALSMTSVQYEMHLSERGQKVDSVQRMLTSMQDPVPAGGSGARVLPGTRDPLGMLHYLRSVDWSKTAEVRSPVYDGHKLYDVRASVVGKAAAVSVPAGKFTATKIEIRVLDNGTEMKDAHFLLYLTNDAARLPVLMEAVLPVATASVELTHWK
jgi:uncharacterized protein DUF3108